MFGREAPFFEAALKGSFAEAIISIVLEFKQKPCSSLPRTRVGFEDSRGDYEERDVVR